MSALGLLRSMDTGPYTSEMAEKVKQNIAAGLPNDVFLFELKEIDSRRLEGEGSYTITVTTPKVIFRKDYENPTGEVSESQMEECARELIKEIFRISIVGSQAITPINTK